MIIISVEFLHFYLQHTKTQSTFRNRDNLPKQWGFEQLGEANAKGATQIEVWEAAAPCSACSPQSRAPVSQYCAVLHLLSVLSLPSARCLGRVNAFAPQALTSSPRSRQMDLHPCEFAFVSRTLS